MNRMTKDRNNLEKEKEKNLWLRRYIYTCKYMIWREDMMTQYMLEFMWSLGIFGDKIVWHLLGLCGCYQNPYLGRFGILDPTHQRVFFFFFFIIIITIWEKINK